MDVWNRWLLVVPEFLKGTVLEFCHNKGMAGHMGIEKTKSRILERAIWYNLRNSCEEYVKGCAVCNRQKKGCRVAREEQQLFHAGSALERVHMDIMGPLMETEKGNTYNKHSHIPPHSHYNRHKNKLAPYTYIYCL